MELLQLRYARRRLLFEHGEGGHDLEALDPRNRHENRVREFGVERVERALRHVRLAERVGMIAGIFEQGEFRGEKIPIVAKQGSLPRRANERAVTTEAFIPVAKTADVPEGGSLMVTVDGREIALFHTGEKFFALDNTCPHQGGPLNEGFISGETVTCPWHAWCFKLDDGSMTMGNFASVDAFDVNIEGDTIMLSATPRPKT